MRRLVTDVIVKFTILATSLLVLASIPIASAQSECQDIYDCQKEYLDNYRGEAVPGTADHVDGGCKTVGPPAIDCTGNGTQWCSNPGNLVSCVAESPWASVDYVGFMVDVTVDYACHVALGQSCPSPGS